MKKITFAFLYLLFSFSCSIFAQDQQVDYAFHFETAKSELPLEAQKAMQQIALQAKDWNSHHIIIQGHTDNIGSDEYNIGLSQDRANDVKKWFVQAGIDPSRIIVNAMGERFPLASNTFEEGRQQNRRVEIALTTEKEINYQAQQVKNKVVLQQLQPEVPSFVLENPQQERYIQAPQGTQIHIPAHAFDVPEGTVVEIKVVEAYKKSDMILHQLSTMSNGIQLVSGGMIKVEALANGQPVHLKDGKKLAINVPSNNPDPRMQIFYADESAQEINWIQPRALSINQGTSTTAPTPAFDPFEGLEALNFVDNRRYSGNAHASPGQICNFKVKNPLNKDIPRPVDKSLTLPKIYPPLMDTAQLVFWRKMKNKIALEVENPCDYADCARLNKKRKKALKKENEERLVNATHQITVQEKKRDRILAEFATYKDRVAAQELKKIQLHKDYLKKHQAWQLELLQIDSVNFEIACINKDILYLQQAHPKQEAEVCQRMFKVNTFEEASEIKHRTIQEAYVNRYLPRDFKLDSIEMIDFITSYPSTAEKNKAFLEMACHAMDTNYVKWRSNEKTEKAFLLNMYAANSIEEVRQIQAAELIAMKRAYFETKMEELGVNSVEEVLQVMQEIKEKKQAWDKQMGYAFETANLGGWINCDYFPGKTDEELIAQKINMPVSPQRTSTYLIFRDIASVMTGQASYQGVDNFYVFNNIPVGKSVEVFSFFVDVKGNTQVALKPIQAQGKTAETLDYKTMTIEEFKIALTQLDV